jgi:hypothetical protein
VAQIEEIHDAGKISDAIAAACLRVLSAPDPSSDFTADDIDVDSIRGGPSQVAGKDRESLALSRNRISVRGDLLRRSRL